MTTPNGNVIFNSSTGSDTQSSGLGPSTAVYGSAASITLDSNVVTGIDTTGVVAGDLLWVQSSTGRQFSIIASVDSATQVTCDYVFEVTESGRTWAIGGKRATLDNVDSRRIIGHLNAQDLPDQCWVEIETNQTITSNVNGHRRRIRSSAGSRKSIIFDFTSTFWSETCMTGSGIYENISFESTNTNLRLGQGSTGSTEGNAFMAFYNCRVYNFHSIGAGFSRTFRMRAFNTVFEDVYARNSSYGFPQNSFNGGSAILSANKCVFKNCGSLYAQASDRGTYDRCEMRNCVFIGDGIRDFATYYLPHLSNCIVSNYANFASPTADSILSSVKNCLIHNISSNLLNLDIPDRKIDDYEIINNYFYNVLNFSNVQGLELYLADGNTTLSQDPLTISGNNVSLNNTINGGNLVRNSEIKL